MPKAMEVFVIFPKFPKADDPKMQELKGALRIGTILFLGIWAVSQWIYDRILNSLCSPKTARDYRRRR